MKVDTSFLYSTNNAKIFSCSSSPEDYPIENILSPSQKALWLSEESLPQQITFDLTSLIRRPLIVHGFGIYCGAASDTNPKIVEILISKKNSPFISLGNYELSLCSGTQVLTTDEILFFDVTYVKFIIKETFGGYRTYINNVFLYEHLPETESVTKVTDSRERNLPRSASVRKTSDDIAPNSGKVLYTRTSEILISESELSENRHMNKAVMTTHTNNDNEYAEKIHKTSIDMNNNNGVDTGKNNMNIVDNLDNNENEENKLIISDPQFENNVNNDNNINKYMQTSSEDPNNINHLLHSQNSVINKQITNTLNSNIGNNNDYLVNEMKNFEITTKEYIDNFDNRIVNLENNLSSIKSKLNAITNKFDNLITYNTNQNQSNYTYLINECNKIIDSKLSTYFKNDVENNNQDYNNITNEHNKSNTNIASLNSSLVSQNNRYSTRRHHFEDILNKKIEEKFATFTKSLEDRIYQSLLKPTLEHLESNLDKNLKEVRKQIKHVAKHRNKSHCKTTVKKTVSAYEKEMRLDSLIDKLQTKLNRQYSTTMNNELTSPIKLTQKKGHQKKESKSSNSFLSNNNM